MQDQLASRLVICYSFGLQFNIDHFFRIALFTFIVADNEYGTILIFYFFFIYKCIKRITVRNNTLTYIYIALYFVTILLISGTNQIDFSPSVVTLYSCVLLDSSSMQSIKLVQQTGHMVSHTDHLAEEIDLLHLVLDLTTCLQMMVVRIV